MMENVQFARIGKGRDPHHAVSAVMLATVSKDAISIVVPVSNPYRARAKVLPIRQANAIGAGRGRCLAQKFREKRHFTPSISANRRAATSSELLTEIPSFFAMALKSLLHSGDILTEVLDFMPPYYPTDTELSI